MKYPLLITALSQKISAVPASGFFSPSFHNIRKYARTFIPNYSECFNSIPPYLPAKSKRIHSYSFQLMQYPPNFKFLVQLTLFCLCYLSTTPTYSTQTQSLSASIALFSLYHPTIHCWIPGNHILDSRKPHYWIPGNQKFYPFFLLKL